jgi:hypothetical protein
LAEEYIGSFPPNISSAPANKPSPELKELEGPDYQGYSSIYGLLLLLWTAIVIMGYYCDYRLVRGNMMLKRVTRVTEGLLLCGVIAGSVWGYD